jgi:hypothetical protein
VTDSRDVEQVKEALEREMFFWERRWLGTTSHPSLVETAVDTSAAQVAFARLVARLETAELERDEALAVRDGFISPVQKVIQERDRAEAAERALSDTREALRGYHDLIPALAECANACGEQLLYSDLKQANDVARAALGVSE